MISSWSLSRDAWRGHRQSGRRSHSRTTSRADNPPCSPAPALGPDPEASGRGRRGVLINWASSVPSSAAASAIYPVEPQQTARQVLIGLSTGIKSGWADGEAILRAPCGTARVAPRGTDPGLRMESDQMLPQIAVEARAALEAQLATETPLSPGARPLARIVGGEPSFRRKALRQFSNHGRQARKECGNSGKKCSGAGRAIRTGRSFQEGSAEQRSLRPVPVGRVIDGNEVLRK